MLHVEVMYADRDPSGRHRQVRVPISHVDDLDKDGVLFLILSKPATEQMTRRTIDGRHYRRADEIWGTDNFVVATYADGGAALWGWDDHSFAWTPEGDPYPDRKVERGYYFRGPCLTVEEWNLSLVQYGEMH